MTDSTMNSMLHTDGGPEKRPTSHTGDLNLCTTPTRGQVHATPTAQAPVLHDSYPVAGVDAGPGMSLILTDDQGKAVTIAGTLDQLLELLRKSESALLADSPVVGPDQSSREHVEIKVTETVDYCQYLDPAKFPAGYDLSEDPDRLVASAVADACSYSFGATAVTDREITV